MTPQRLHNRQSQRMAPRSMAVAKVLPQQQPQGWWILPGAALGLAAYSLAALALLRLV
ncbi:hypothetical protein [Thioclava kandeliae]|uniref:DUF58 domain-containing protein n=1 Tax=Thioclava kandeliae TaxID=3070818 RepID=A0ABV1SER5_9RHOB